MVIQPEPRVGSFQLVIPMLLYFFIQGQGIGIGPLLLYIHISIQLSRVGFTIQQKPPLQ